MALPRVSEAEVIARIQRLARGDTDLTHSLAQSQDELFSGHKDRLVALCRRIVGNPDRAEDLAAAAMLTAWEKIIAGEFRGDSSVYTFLVGIARFKCFRAIQQRTEVLLEEDALFAVASPERNAFQELTREARIACVREAVQGLAPLDQEVLTLRYEEELPYDAIERVLGIDRAELKSGVRGILVRCKRDVEGRIRTWLSDHGHGGSFLASEN